MSEWIEVRLGDILDFHRGYDLPKSDMENGDIPVAGSNGVIGYHNKATEISPCITIGRSGSIGQPYYYEKAWAHNTVLYIDDFKGNNPKFLYYLIKTLPISKYAGGSAVPSLNRNHIHPLLIKFCDNVEIQNQIAGILSSLDAKIETNNKLNEKLEEMAQAIFKSWFVDFEPFKNQPFHKTELGMIPKGWKVVSLCDIANFTNGLAMQKYRPNDDEPYLPVLKIKELRQGFCDDTSEICTNDISEDYIADDGDVIFSWSGTLLVDIWCGGECGVNQHLFKVTSDIYNKWFYYFWIKKHLAEFIRIAKDKAVTMGHIKRGHLRNALVVVPNNKTLQHADKILSTIINRIIETKVESKRLASLRDTLLPRLMSGEIKI
ncbi:MAG: restriction endonuclease subunit S [Prevotella sp.]